MMRPKHKPSDLFCTAHKKFLTPYELENRNCTKQPCKHLATLLVSKSFEEEVNEFQ